MRFIGALETLLDPIVAVLDALPAHFSADHAPRDILNLLAAWLGVELDESQTPAQRRAMVRQAAELGRRRGTRAGLDLALSLAFPKLPLRVEDLGGVRTTPPEGGMDTPAATFIVYCDKPIAEEQPGGGRALHRAVQAGTHDVPATRESGEEEGRRRARMRTCQSCGKQNPPDRDFCDCGEYLRWEPTGFVDAVTPEMAAAAATRRRRPPPDAAPAQPAASPRSPPPPPAAARRRRRGPQPPAPAAAPPNGGQPAMRTQVQGAVPAPAAPPPVPEPQEPAEADSGVDHAEPARRGVGARARSLAVGVHPGDRTRVQRPDPQPVADRRQLPDPRRGPARGVVLRPARHGLPGALRHRRDLRAADRDPLPPAARRRGRGADLGARGRRALQGPGAHRRHRAAAARHPAVHRPRHQGQARARVGPAQGELRRARQEQGQRARVRRLRRHRGRQRAARTGSTRPRPRSSPARRSPRACASSRPSRSGSAGRTSAASTSRPRPARRPTALAAAADGEPEEGLAEGGGVRGKLRGKKVPGVHGPQIYKPQVYKPNVHLGPGGLQMSKADGPRPAGPRPPDAGHEPQPQQPEDARRPGAARHHRAAAADPGRLPPEAVAALVGRDRDPAAAAARAPALPLPAQERRRCPTSSASPPPSRRRR